MTASRCATARSWSRRRTGRVKIYATDVDEEALETVCHGTYLPRQIEDVPREAVERFFERSDQRYVFRKDLRRSVIFGRNDLIQDAPISRIDLLVCRNTLMYFTADTQARILRRFHFALGEDGVQAVRLPRLSVDAVDATGGGDAFVATLAVLLAEECELEAAGRLAVAAAAHTVGHLGGRPTFADRAALRGATAG